MASLPLLLALLTAAPPLTTLSEQSGWRRTGRYDEVLRLCDAFPQAYPGKARCERFGVTPEGRPMVALVVSSDGVLEPKAAQAKGRPVVLFQGGIHAGEIDGKDAGFWLLRDVLDGKALPGVLGKVTAVFVPVFNIDGHERFGPNNRPNQRGPEQMGFRTTAQGFNLNRDYVKAEAPEMAAMLGLLGRWDPLIYVDLHVTDGAKFRHDVAVMAQPLHSGAPELRPLALEASDAVLSELTAQGHLPLPFYPSFRKEDDPMSGFAAGVAPPRFSQAYWAARNRIGVLVETHAWFDYPHRVKTTRNVVQAWLRRAAEDGPALLEAARAADARDRRAGATEVVLAIDTTEKSRPIPFQGFAYVVEPSEISGTTWTRYDETRPELWTLPLFDELKVTLTGRSPAGGYVVPAAHAAWVGQKLKLHGFEFEVLEKDRPAAEVEAFRATEVKPARARSYEGRVPLSIQGAWAKEKRDVPRGSLYVPANQRGRELLVHLLDPVSPESLAAWALFNHAFEQKEYMEAYIAEAEAREMLARDPALKSEFMKKLGDPAFARDPGARLDFFKRRHPSWDDRYNLYPVYRVQAPPR